MFCRNCGSEMKDGTKFCPRCGTPAAAQSSPAQDMGGQDPGTYGTGQQGQPSGEQNQWTAQPGQPAGGPQQWQGEPPRKKKGSKKKVIIPVAAAAVVAAAGIGAFAFTQSNFFQSKFSSPEEYYRSVEEAYIDKEMDALSNAVSGEEINEITASVQLEDAGVAMLGLSGYISDAEIAALGDLEARISTGENNGISGAQAALYSGEESIISANAVIDADSGNLYVQIPELSESYIRISQDAASMDFGELLNMNTVLDFSMLPDMLPKYLDVMLDYTTDVERQDSTLTVGGISQDATLLEVRIGSDQLKNIAVDLMELMQNDKDLEELLVNLGDYMMATDPYFGYTGEEFYAQAMDRLQETIDEARAEEVPESAAVEMDVWVDGDGNIIGRTITLIDSEETLEVFNSLTAEDGGNYATELSVGDISNGDYVSLEGEGTVNGNLAEGNYSLKSADEEVAQIRVSDYDVKLAEEGYLNGTFLFTSDADPSLAGYELQAQISSDRSSTDAVVSIMSSEVPIATLNLGFSGEGSYEPVLPSDETVYDGDDSEDMSAYESEIDQNALEARMRNNAFLSWMMDNL